MLSLSRGLLMGALAPALLLLTACDRSSEAAPADGAQAVAEAPAQDVARDPIPLDHPELIPITVYQSPQCGCCGLWVEHIREHGFEPEVRYQADMGEVKAGFGISFALSSCHTGVVNGYVIEGHVPGDVIRRFLAEAPAARGLTVPGMPLGSPGMELPDGRVDEYAVLLFTSAGEVSEYSRHGTP